jgi:Gpi18-like mannosyltransferase
LIGIQGGFGKIFSEPPFYLSKSKSDDKIKQGKIFFIVVFMNKHIIKIFLIWLFLLSAVGLYSEHLSVYKGAKCEVKNQLPYYRWDSFWYTSIARHGYSFSEVKNSSIAFFPLYPMVIRLTHWVSHIKEDYLSLGLNMIFTFLAISYLYKLARFDYSEKESLAVVAIFLFFEPAYFFLSGYPDILFVLLAILSLYFARKGKWGGAGISAGLLAITKPYGIFILPVLAVEYLWSNAWNFKVLLRKKDWLALFLPILSFGSFIFFNYWKFQNPLAFLDTQKTWGRSLANPLAALFQEFKYYLLGGNIFTGSNFPYSIYLGCFVFSLLAFWLCWKTVRKTYLLFAFLLLLSALLTGTLTSWGRYMLLGFPIFMGPAVYLAKKKWWFYGYLVISATIMIFAASFFVRCFPFE